MYNTNLDSLEFISCTMHFMLVHDRPFFQVARTIYPMYAISSKCSCQNHEFSFQGSVIITLSPPSPARCPQCAHARKIHAHDYRHATPSLASGSWVDVSSQREWVSALRHTASLSVVRPWHMLSSPRGRATTPSN